MAPSDEKDSLLKLTLRCEVRTPFAEKALAFLLSRLSRVKIYFRSILQPAASICTCLSDWSVGRGGEHKKSNLADAWRTNKYA